MSDFSTPSSRRRHWCAAIVALGPTLLPVATLACGGEVPLSCSTPEDDARTLLKQAAVAVQTDKARSLRWFTEESHGFRTEDLYVFCIGPDGTIDAHPDPALRGTNAHALIDRSGKHFGDEIMARARSDALVEVTYLWPRLNTTDPVLKHTMATRISDEICAVGYYE